MRPDQERVQNLLRDTVTTLCRNSLVYRRAMRVQGLLGISLDDDDVFTVHFNEVFQGVGAQEVTIQQADSVADNYPAETYDSEDSQTMKVPTTTTSSPVAGRSRRKAQPWRAIGGLSEPATQREIKHEEEPTENILGTAYPLYPAQDTGGDVDIMKQSYMRDAPATDDATQDYADDATQDYADDATQDYADDATTQGGPFIAGVAHDYSSDTTAGAYQYDSSGGEVPVDLSSGVTEQVPGHMLEGLPDGLEWDQYTNPPDHTDGVDITTAITARATKRARQIQDFRNNNSSSIRLKRRPSANHSVDNNNDDNDEMKVRKRRLPGRLGNLKEQHKCKDCGKVYWTRNTLVRHQKVHNPDLFVCKKCTLFFPSEDRLMAHDKAKHCGPAWGRYNCGVCGKKFRSNNHLIGHMNTFHAKDPNNWSEMGTK